MLRARIATMPPGERMSSDTELCAEFGVRRVAAATRFNGPRKTA